MGGLPVDRHRGEAVFEVKGLGVGESVFHALNHITVCVVGVGLAGTERGDRVFVGGVGVRVGGGVGGRQVEVGVGVESISPCLRFMNCLFINPCFVSWIIYVRNRIYSRKC